MQHTKVIAIQQHHPFLLAARSAQNAFHLLIDFMYGTPERTKGTFLFALGLALLGGLMFNNASANQVCTY